MKLLIFLALLVIFTLQSFKVLPAPIDVDELLYDATILITKNEFSQAYETYLSIINLEPSLTYSQKVNAYYGLLELSYILKTEELAVKYGDKLIRLLSKNSKYSKMHQRVLQRLCVSQDWEIYRHRFSKICAD